MYCCILIRADDTNHLDIQTIFDLIFQVISIIALIHITFLWIIVFVKIGRWNYLIGEAQQVIIGVRGVWIRLRLTLQCRTHHLLHLADIPDAKRIQLIIADLVILRHDHHDFIVILRPASGYNIILVLEQLLIADHLGPDIRRTLRPCHTQVIHLWHRTKSDTVKDGTWIDLIDFFLYITFVSVNRNAIGVHDIAGVVLHLLTVTFLDIILEGYHVVNLDFTKHILHIITDKVVWIHLVHIMLFFTLHLGAEHNSHHCGHVNGLIRDLQRVGRKSIFLHALDIIPESIGQR